MSFAGPSEEEKGKKPQIGETAMPFRPPGARKPEEGKGIKVYSFEIEKLREENARYWFRSMKKQLESQCAWKAIEYCQDIGVKAFREEMSDQGWKMANLKADVIIEKGLSSNTVLEVDDLGTAYEKWMYLRNRFLRATNSMKAMAFSTLATWVWDRSKRNMIEDYFEFKGKLKEFAEMNGGCTIDLFQMGIIWHLNGLGNDHAVFRDTLMGSEAVLDEPHVLRKMRDYMQLNWSRKTGQRTLQNPKCFACQGYGHMANGCPNNQDNSSADEQKKPKKSRPRRHPKKSRDQKPRPKQRARAAEDEPQRASESNDDGYKFSALAMEEEPLATESASLIQEEAYRAGGDPTKWYFDSGATSMSTGNRNIFESMRPYFGTLTIASGTQMPIEGRDVVKFSLPDGTQARLGGVIYVPGLAENLLSLEALHLAGLESRGSLSGYKILRKGKVVAKGKRTGRTTYLHSVNNMNALLVDAQKSKQFARLALSENGEVSEKQSLIHSRLGHPGLRRFNYCVANMDMNDLRLRIRTSYCMMIVRYASEQSTSKSRIILLSLEQSNHCSVCIWIFGARIVMVQAKKSIISP